MAWLSQTNNRPIRDLEFYQRKALSFLFSSEGKDDMRCLNIPFAQLGFLSPMHFLSLIPEELCEPYRNDKLFLASSGTVRKGDKVLVLEKGTEGVIRSAIFKGRRVRQKTGETEIILDGHRRPYTEEEVVPYKEHLRQHLGTSLLPENNYVISPDGILKWEEPSWEPGQDVYYKPEKRWATVLTHETSPKGKDFAVIKLDETQAKKEKTTRVSLNELMAHSVPVRIPKRVQGDCKIASSSSGAGSSSDEIIIKANGKADRMTNYAVQESDDDSVRAVVGAKRNGDLNVSFDSQIDRNSSSLGGNETIYAEVLPRKHETMKTEQNKGKGGFSFAKNFLRKKPSKVTPTPRPVSEYIPKSSEQPNHINGSVDNGLNHDNDEIKSKSYNNLNATLSDDDDMEQHFELVNYTNSLRSSARKIIQKQLARDSTTRTSSLRASSNSSASRPHVAEIFTVSNSSTLKKKSIQTTQIISMEEESKPEKPMRTKHLKMNSTIPTSQVSSNGHVNHRDATKDHTDGTRIPSTYNSTLLSDPLLYPTQATRQYPRESPIPTSFLHQPYLKTSPSPTSFLQQQYTRSTPTPTSSLQQQYTRSSPIPIIHLSSYSKSSYLSTITSPSTTSAFSKSCPLSTVSSPNPGPIPTPRSTYASSGHLPVVTSAYPRAASPLFTIAPYSSSPLTTTITQSKSPSPTPLQTNSQPYTRKYNPPPSLALEYLRLKNSKPNPLEYKFLPLASSNLVKKQISLANSALHEPEKNASSEYIVISPKFTEPTGVSSDSSGHNDNDSGRGSYRQTPDIDKRVKIKPGCDVIYETSPKTRRHPGFEMFQNAEKVNSQSASPSENKHGTINNNLQRRFTKNKAVSKHSLAKYLNGNENEEYYEDKLPQPYNPANLCPVIGYGKGIQGTANSSYADATLYALFACSNIFDKHLLFSKPGQVERGLKRDVRTILSNKIVAPLRTTSYCKAENVTHLREAMLPLSSKMHSSLIDAEEFLYLLFDSALNIESFIEFSNGSKDYIHQIIARPKDRSKSQTVQYMLETSLGTAGHKFKRTPSPALFLCMPRCKGRLVYYEAIIPSLQLNITKLLHSGPKQCVCEMPATLECSLCKKKNGEIALDFCGTCKGIADQIHLRLDHSPVLTSKSQKDEILNLHSIICTRGNHYVAFVKASEQRLSPWMFFDPMAGEYPEVTLLEDFGRWLDSLENQPGSFREFAKVHPLLKRIITDGHIYIYSKTHLSDDASTNISESFSI